MLLPHVTPHFQLAFSAQIPQLFAMKQLQICKLSFGFPTPRPCTASTPLRDKCNPCKFISALFPHNPLGFHFENSCRFANRWQFQAATCMQNIVQLLNNSSAPCYKLQIAKKKSNNRSRLQLGHSDNSASLPDILAYPMIRTGQCNCATQREKYSKKRIQIQLFLF